MRREVGVTIVDVRDDWASNSAEFDVAVISCDLEWGFEGAHMNITVVGGNDGGSCRREGDR